ncbi:sodium-dependent bicarbonate transport family permease [Plastoroseomonas arctica]|uniref:sodium-dependent bicarbonate transport family permease n=1 Tax=Plastoroseomonas arctica TaxID=1509237 RepID=UPI001FE7C2E1|nr:sodium-dependent bicarbonate transport family permease [Plastoroseomonas arctica]
MTDLLTNLLSPAVLCFLLGAAAYFAKSDLRLPDAIFNVVSVYLMLSIGLKGGASLAAATFSAFALPALGAMALGCLITLWSYAFLRRLGGFGTADAAAVAAHYGSVSAVTFAAVVDWLTRSGVAYEGYVAALLALLEAPAILIALSLAGAARATASDASGNGHTRIGAVVAEVASGKSIVVLVGGLLIGAVVGTATLAPVKPFFVDLFPGVLCLFLLDLGRAAAERLRDFHRAGPVLVGFAIGAPLLHGALGVGVAWLTGMSVGGAIVLGTLAASASYIAAPAAVRLALPEANPGLYLTASLAITFPFNIVLGIGIYAAMARALYGVG